MMVLINNFQINNLINKIKTLINFKIHFNKINKLNLILITKITFNLKIKKINLMDLLFNLIKITLKKQVNIIINRLKIRR